MSSKLQNELDLAKQQNQLLCDLKAHISHLVSEQKTTQIDREKAYQEQRELVGHLDLHEASIETIEKLISIVSENDIKALKDLLNQGISIVFSDRPYQVDITIDKKRGAQGVHFWLIEQIHGSVVKSEIRDEVGGGVVAVVGLLIQVFYIQFLGFERIIIMDEGLSQVSSDYVDGLFRLLKLLDKELGFKFLMISHDQRFFPLADNVYTVTRGTYRKQEESKV